MKNFNFKQLLQIFILAITDCLVFSGTLYLPYILPNFYNYLGITSMELSWLQALSGFIGLITRIPGGWLADNFNTKRIFLIGVFSTAILGIVWTLVIQLKDNLIKETRLYLYAIVYAGWGISITGFFWSPLWKLLSYTTTKEKQGLAFGIQGSLVGFLGMVFVTGGATLVAYLVMELGYEDVFYIFAYSIMILLILGGILGVFYLNPIIPITKTSLWEKIKNILKPLKLLRIWYCSFFVLGMYMFQSVFASTMKDLLARIGISTVIVAIFGGFRSYALRFLVSGPIGKRADKWNSIINGLIGFTICGFVLSIIFLLTPNLYFALENKVMKLIVQIMSLILFLAIGVLAWILLTLRFVQIKELNTKKEDYGSIVGAISLIAFSPNAWFNYIKSLITKDYQETINLNGKLATQTNVKGLQILLSISLAFVLLGLIFAFLMQMNIKKHKLIIRNTMF